MKTKLLTILAALFITGASAQTVTDADGNIYDTVHIGTQVWLKQNLATTKYNDGTSIPLVTDSIAWFNLATPGYCWYKNDAATYKNPYGALYNWFAVNTGKLCPSGWHVPTNDEWHTLVLFLDPAAQNCYCTESAIAGNALKEAGLAHWGNGNNGNNSSGFTALGTGFRNYFNKSYQGFTAVTYYWTSSPNDPYTTAWHRWMQNSSANVFEYLDKKTQGMSVRCLIDNINSIPSTGESQLPQVFPNPATDKLTIVCQEYNTAEVFNIIGECILKLNLDKGDNIIDISSLPAQVYILKLTNGHGSIQKKIVKQ